MWGALLDLAPKIAEFAGKAGEVIAKVGATALPKVTETAVKAGSWLVKNPFKALVGAMAVDNITTDPIWAGNMLGVLPEQQKSDINKRAISITKLLSSGKSIIYDAQKSRRPLTKSEKELLAKTAEEAEKEIDQLDKDYKGKFTVSGHAELVKALEQTITNLRLQVENFRKVAGIMPHATVNVSEFKGIVVAVHDGDTITVRTAGAAGLGGKTKPSAEAAAEGKQDVVIRVVGIDTPESVTPAGKIAGDYLRKRILGKEVTIKLDPEHPRGVYGRILGVIYLDGENINMEMLKKGYAKYFLPEPNSQVYPKLWKAAAQMGVDTSVNIPLSDLKASYQTAKEQLRSWRSMAKANVRAIISDQLDQLKSDAHEKIDQLRDWYRDEKDKLREWYRSQKNDVYERYRAKEIDRATKYSLIAQIRERYIQKKIELRKKYREEKIKARDPWKQAKINVRSKRRELYNQISQTYYQKVKALREEYNKNKTTIKQHLGISYNPEVKLPTYSAPSIYTPKLAEPKPTSMADACSTYQPTPEPSKIDLKPTPPSDLPHQVAINQVAEQLKPTQEIIQKEAEKREAETGQKIPVPTTHALATMKWVTVGTHWLNVRQEPNSKSALAGSRHIKPHARFQIKGWVTGENIAGEDRWWVTVYNNYVWVGGTIDKPSTTTTQQKEIEKAVANRDVERQQEIKATAEELQKKAAPAIDYSKYYKIKNPQGYFDVYTGTHHLTSDEFKKLGLNVDHIREVKPNINWFTKKGDRTEYKNPLTGFFADMGPSAGARNAFLQRKLDLGLATTYDIETIKKYYAGELTAPTTAPTVAQTVAQKPTVAPTEAKPTTESTVAQTTASTVAQTTAPKRKWHFWLQKPGGYISSGIADSKAEARKSCRNWGFKYLVGQWDSLPPKPTATAKFIPTHHYPPAHPTRRLFKLPGKPEIWELSDWQPPRSGAPNGFGTRVHVPNRQEFNKRYGSNAWGLVQFIQQRELDKYTPVPWPY